MGMFDAATRIGRTILDEVMDAATRDKGYMTSALNNTLEGYYSGGGAGSIVNTWTRQIPDIARSMVSPRGRALYRERGLNPVAQADIARQLEEASGLEANTSEYNKLINEAKARAEYTVYSPTQMGVDLPENMPQTRTMERAYLVNPTEYNEKKFKGLVKGFKNRGYKVSEEEADNMYNQLNKWLDSNDIKFNESDKERFFAVRHPFGAAGASGHWQKFFSQHAILNPVAEAFRDLEGAGRKVFRTVDELKEALEAKGVKVSRVDSDGVYIDSSFVGGERTDGGVNLLTKIKKDGRGLAFVSDEHNFLEKLPVLGKQIEKGIKRRLVTVTPPMPFHIKMIREKQAGNITEGGYRKADYDVGMATRPVTDVGYGWREALGDIATAEPSREAINRERRRLALRAGASSIAAGYGMFGGEDA